MIFTRRKYWVIAISDNIRHWLYKLRNKLEKNYFRFSEEQNLGGTRKKKIRGEMGGILRDNRVRIWMLAV